VLRHRLLIHRHSWMRGLRIRMRGGVLNVLHSLLRHALLLGMTLRHHRLMIGNRMLRNMFLL
jgi:hypothetical protein